MTNPQIWQMPSLRDFAGVWAAAAAGALDGIDPKCFRFTLWTAPKFLDRNITLADSYRQSQLPLQAGSFIMGLSQTGGFTQSGAFSVQVTDLSSQRPLFNAPIENTALRNGPFWFADLYPVITPGLFRVEIWNTSDDVIKPEVALLVAEPRGGVIV